MKKLIILTALISAISVFSYADSLEKIEYKSEYGTGNINNSKREYSQFMNELSGKINLDDAITTPLKGNGDFRSDECIKILEESDIVVTNPPFSLFREYIAQLIEYNKKFVIIGSVNALSYKEIFKSINRKKRWTNKYFSI